MKYMLNDHYTSGLLWVSVSSGEANWQTRAFFLVITEISIYSVTILSNFMFHCMYQVGNQTDTLEQTQFYIGV